MYINVVTHIHKSCVHIYIYIPYVPHSYVSQDSFMRVTWLIHVWRITHVKSDLRMYISLCASFICVSWHIHRCDMTNSCVTYHVCKKRCAYVYITRVYVYIRIGTYVNLCVCMYTHSYVWCDSYMWHEFKCVTWLIPMCDMTRSYVWHRTHSYVWRDSFICVTWLIHMCDMTHSYVSHDSFICVTWLIHMCDMTHSYVSLH